MAWKSDQRARIQNQLPYPAIVRVKPKLSQASLDILGVIPPGEILTDAIYLIERKTERLAYVAYRAFGPRLCGNLN
jgi:hypothetical protein